MVTVGLLAYSYYVNFSRVGIMVRLRSLSSQIQVLEDKRGPSPPCLLLPFPHSHTCPCRSCSCMTYRISSLKQLSSAGMDSIFQMGCIFQTPGSHVVHPASILIFAFLPVRYCGQQVSANVVFALFFVSWVVLRIIYFPLVIIR